MVHDVRAWRWTLGWSRKRNGNSLSGTPIANLPNRKLAHLPLLAAVAFACWSHPTSLVAASTITYVQGNYATPQTPQATVTVPFTAAQTAGDLNVVVVGWGNSPSTVTSVTDTSGNTYTLAVGLTLVSSYAYQSIYYAKNIKGAAAGTNTVTVDFSPAAPYPDIRILEYSGADPNNPVDVTAAGTGSKSPATSGAATTTNATDLIFGADLGWSGTSGPGRGFTQRIHTSPDDDIAEDKMVTATGRYSATAPLFSPGPWVMQMVAFRTPVSTADPGTLAASPTTVSFGSVAVGSKASENVVLSDTGSASVTLSAVAVTGAGFSASGLSFPLTLAAGQTATLTVTFTPSAAGSVSGSVAVASSASNATLTVPLSGTGTTQTLSVSPTTLSFGDVTIGSSSSLPVVLTNTGTASLTLSQATTTGAGFSVSGFTANSSLAAAQTTSLTVTFAPSSAGSVTGKLSVTSTATNSPTVVSLSATGADQHSVTLTWTASSSSNVTGYNVYRGAASGGPYTKINSSLLTATTYTDATVDAGQTYYYVATAVNSQGLESADSNQAEAVIPSP
jgi:hypothetical protein